MMFTHSNSGLAVLAAVILSVTGGCATASDKVAIAKVDGRNVAYRVLSSGTPTLIMISGLGDDMKSFEAVAEDLSQHATVILYDRAGYGGSADVSGVRDAMAAENELSQMLSQAGFKGPYILLGHSLWGLFAEYYAARHPDQIAGLILEESRPADFTRRCQAAGVKACVPPAALVAFLPKGAKAEYAALSITTAEVEAIKPVSGKPVLVLSRAVGADASPFEASWAAGQEALAARYPGADHLIASTRSHYLHKDKKNWFVAVVRAFFAYAPDGASQRP